MTYEIFEGVKQVKIMKNKKERDMFKTIKDKLEIKTDVELIKLCFSLGLYCKELKSEKLEKMPSSTKVADMSVLSDSKYLDLLILTELGIEENRIDIFYDVFYTGFKKIERWFDTRGNFAKTTIEAFSSLKEYFID